MIKYKYFIFYRLYSMNILKQKVLDILKDKIQQTIPREKYLISLEKRISLPLIKVITWPRRVGKSYYLYMVLKYLLEHQKLVESQIFYVNKEWSEFFHLKDGEELELYFQECEIDTSQPFFVGIDEAQEILWFETFINNIQSKYHNAIIYITWSNSKLLSSKYATLLAGRYLEQRIYPLSISEFCSFGKKKLNTETLQEYFAYGALPQIVSIEDQQLKIEYLRWVYNTVFTKDIVEFFHLRKSSLLRKIHGYLFKELGNLFTANNIAKFFQSQKIQMSVDMVLDYLEYSKDAFLFHDIPRYDIKGKKLLEVNSKIYTFDLWIRNAVVGFDWLQEREKYLEHIVLSHLLLYGWEVYIGVLWDKEIDFIAIKWEKKWYIQVCYLLTDERVIEREFWNLLQIQDNHPKIVVSMDPVEYQNYEGIQHRSLLNFLEKLDDQALF